MAFRAVGLEPCGNPLLHGGSQLVRVSDGTMNGTSWLVGVAHHKRYQPTDGGEGMLTAAAGAAPRLSLQESVRQIATEFGGKKRAGALEMRIMVCHPVPCLRPLALAPPPPLPPPPPPLPLRAPTGLATLPAPVASRGL